MILDHHLFFSISKQNKMFSMSQKSPWENPNNQENAVSKVKLGLLFHDL